MPSHQLNRKLLFLLVLLCPLFMNFDGCSPKRTSAGNPPPPGGFTVQIVDINRNGTQAVHAGGTVSGNWLRDPSPNTNTVGATESFGVSPQPFSVVGGRAPAVWGGMWDPIDNNCLNRINFPNGTTYTGITMNLHLANTVGSCNTPPLGGVFAMTNSVPGTLTATGSGFSSSGGMPQLSLYDSQLNLITQESASSVAQDGNSATFAFPSSLSFGHYSFNVGNVSGGSLSKVGVGLLSVATNDTSKASPFGVDAIDIANTYSQCDLYGGNCTVYDTPSGAHPLLTYSTLNQVCLPVYCTQVGNTPVAIKAYDVETVTATGTFYIYGIPYFNWTSVTTGPRYALVANYGSNTVSRIDVLSPYTVGSLNVLNTINVGSQPVALVVKPDGTKAYVANYGSGTISEINIATQTQSRTVYVGSSPLSLSLDPGGTALWVGGLNYIAKVDLSSFAVLSTFSASGQVGSLAISAGQNAIVYSAVATGQYLYQAQNASVSNGATQQTFVSASTVGTAFASGTPGYQLASVSLVSADANNRYAVTSTPTGFALLDLQTQSTMLTGTTPSAVRGLAMDPLGQMIYLTAAESNSFITVPGPPSNNQ
jgi:YVTN family beta-propeller protein